MPSFRLSSTIQAAINSRTVALCNNRLNHMAASCPFTNAMVQEVLVPDPATREALFTAAAQGIGVPTVLMVDIVFSAASWGGAIPRSLVVQLTRLSGAYVQRAVTIHSLVGGASAFAYDSSFKAKRPGAYVTPSMLPDPVVRAEVVAWANKLVREARLATIARLAVETAMESCENTAEVIATWPFLTTLVTDPFWQARFRNGPRFPNRYVNHELLRKLPKVNRDATEVFLNGAAMMDTFEPDPVKIQAAVVCYSEAADPKDYAP